jgi:Helix-turn-helix domain of resolvase
VISAACTANWPSLGLFWAFRAFDFGSGLLYFGAKRIGRPRALAPVDVERARKLIDDGKSLRAAARELGIGAATLHRALGAAS